MPFSAPTKIDYRKKCTLILTSLLEDLVLILTNGYGLKPMAPFWDAPPILVYFSWDWDVHWG